MFRRSMSTRPIHKGFTLVELLVVIGIIALLISILMPSLVGARQSARAAASLSNLRQLSNGVMMYINEFRGYYPAHSSLSSMKPRMRWPDYIYPYVKSTKVFISPMLNGDESLLLSVAFSHTLNQTTGDPIPGETIYWGGYGYNFQYLGNSRQLTPAQPQFHARAGSEIKATSQTIMIADTHGSKNGGPNWTNQAVYAIDPPLASLNLGSKGSRKAPGAYGYAGGTDGTFDPDNPSSNTAGDASYRATPAERNKGFVNVVFCDGHAEAMKLKAMDDFNGDGFVDNGYWNGRADPTVR